MDMLSTGKLRSASLSFAMFGLAKHFKLWRVVTSQVEQSYVTLSQAF